MSKQRRVTQSKDPAVVYFHRLRLARRRAERMAEAIVRDVGFGANYEAPDSPDSADPYAPLVKILAGPPQADETDDERHGAELAAAERAAYLLGFAVGQRMPRLESRQAVQR